jgi:hypothetical protein
VADIEILEPGTTRVCGRTIVMALIIIPRNTGPEAVAEAERKFKAAIDDLLTVVAVVYGDGPDIERVLEVCCARALTKPPIRRVVWVPDPSVLTDALKAKYWKPTRPAVFVGLDDKIAKTLTAVQAKVRICVEEAFLRAEGQGGG